MTVDSHRKTQLSLQTLLSCGSLGAKTDVQLIDLFRTRSGEASGEAFRMILERHGAMVQGVCRNTLGDSCDSDDAFQATFLVLVQKAHSIRKGESLGPWLHGVALRVARRARNQRRRRDSLLRLVDLEMLARHPARDEARSEASAAIDEEIERLPARLREPLVLCCLEGRSYDEAARALGLNESSLRGRLHRGRKKLEDRLRARGDFATGLLANPWSPPHPEPKLLEAVLRFSMPMADSNSIASAHLSNSVLSLAKGAALAMTLTTFKSMAAIGALAGVCVFGTVVVARQAPSEKPTESRLPTEEHHKAAEPARTQAIAPATPLSEEEKEGRDRRILRALDQQFQAKLPDPVILEDLLKAIKKETMKPDYPGVPIYVDPIGLSEAGENMKSPIPVGWKGARIRETLGHSLRLLKLDYVVQDGFVMIDSKLNTVNRRLALLEKKLDRVLRLIEAPEPKE